jgi:hypothetical protein
MNGFSLPMEFKLGKNSITWLKIIVAFQSVYHEHWLQEIIGACLFSIGFDLCPRLPFFNHGKLMVTQILLFHNS